MVGLVESHQLWIFHSADEIYNNGYFFGIRSRFSFHSWILADSGTTFCPSRLLHKQHLFSVFFIDFIPFSLIRIGRDFFVEDCDCSEEYVDCDTTLELHGEEYDWEKHYEEKELLHADWESEMASDGLERDGSCSIRF